ncbi:MAG: hypothetical protein AAFU65_09590 [Pseudomonadota bacterium]
MSARTRLVLVLVVLILVFAAVMTIGLLFSRDEAPRPGQPPASADSAFLQALTRFSPSIELSGLRCNGAPVTREFALDRNQSNCSISIPGDQDNDVRSAKIATRTPDLTRYVHAVFESRDNPKSRRDPDTCIVDDANLAAFRLEIRYDPKDGPDGDTWSCWLKQPAGKHISIVAMKDGGRLSLRCAGCDSDARRIKLRLTR